MPLTGWVLSQPDLRIAHFEPAPDAVAAGVALAVSRHPAPRHYPHVVAGPWP